MDFARTILDVVSTSSCSNTPFQDTKTRNIIFEIAAEQTDCAMFEFDIVARNKTSHIAAAALLNAIESLYYNNNDNSNELERGIIYDEIIATVCSDCCNLQWLQ